jgi:hypothetical protein
LTAQKKSSNETIEKMGEMHAKQLETINQKKAAFEQ